MQGVKCLLSTMILFCLLDYLWLGVIGKQFYLESLGTMLRTQGSDLNPRIPAAVVVYILFAVSIWFIVLPLGQGKVLNVVLYGAFFGAVIYGIYDMTNLAVMQQYSLKIALIDWIWGIFLCATTSGFCMWLKNFIS